MLNWALIGQLIFFASIFETYNAAFILTLNINLQELVVSDEISEIKVEFSVSLLLVKNCLNHL